MKNIFFLLGLFLLLCNCKRITPIATVSVPLKKDNQDCEMLLDYFKENWTQHATGFYGFKGDSVKMKEVRKTFNRKRGNQCFIGFTKTQMYDLLGVPSNMYASNDSIMRIEYYFNSICNTHLSGCVRLKIELNSRADTIAEVLPINTEFVQE